MLVYTFWCIDRFQNHRNLKSDLYPWKSSGPNDKHFQGLPYNNFSNTFYEYSKFLRSILPFNLLIYSSVQNRSEIKSLFRKIQTKAISNARARYARVKTYVFPSQLFVNEFSIFYVHKLSLWRNATNVKRD